MKNFAIVGIGPRGLFALEQALANLGSFKKEVNITAFETNKEAGIGAAWDMHQPDSNWANVSERFLENIKGRPNFSYANIEFKSFPSYEAWNPDSEKASESEIFPPRNKVGKYLHERFQSLISLLVEDKKFTFINATVTHIKVEDDTCIIITEDDDVFYFDEILLTIGHQSTELSKQILDWKAHDTSQNDDSFYLFENPYPVQQFNIFKNKKNSTVAIRGYGLAAIDVIRAFTINDYGHFEVVNTATRQCVYRKLKEQDLMLVPFSLDGKPLSPKPVNKNIDAWYKPSASELDVFENDIYTVAHKTKGVTDISFLTTSFSKIAGRVFLSLESKAKNHNLNTEELEELIEKWLLDEDISHELFQQKTEPYNYIKSYVNMAIGNAPISLDYCIGQVWRHCQPTLYRAFSHAKLDESIIKKVIVLDESTKRYSYGPPIESMQQLLALIDAGVLNLDFVDNPDIETTNKGWKFTNAKGKSITAEIMIDSVLDAPKLLEVNSPIVTSLLKNDVIQPIHSELGIHTDSNGYVISENNSIPIAVLGRLSKGSVIGVDAILECFGKRIENWAKAFVKNI